MPQAMMDKLKAVCNSKLAAISLNQYILQAIEKALKKEKHDS